MVEFLMKEPLFQSKVQLKNFAGLRIGMQSAKGVACDLNTSPSQTSKISLVGVAVDMIMEGRIAVANHSTKRSYVEYHTKTGDVLSMILEVLPEHDGFFVKARQTAGGLGADVYAKKAVTVAAISAMLYCPDIRAGLCSGNRELDGIFADLDTHIDVSVNYKDMSVSNNDLFLACDLMYYGMFKNNMRIVLDVLDTDVFDEQMERVLQNDQVRHIPETASLENYPIPDPKKEKAAKNRNPLFTEPLADFFERCKKGEFLIKHPWPEIRKNMIVPLSFLESFFPTESFRLMLLSVWYQIKEVQKRMGEIEKRYPGKKLSELIQEGAYDEVMGKNPINIKVMGKPGTGKTTVIEAVLASLGYPKGLINCKDRMEEDEIEGQNKFVNGTVLNIPTKAGQLHSDGGAILLEEFNLPDPGILQGALGQALAYPFILKEDGYKEKRRHPLTIYFATMNIGTAGTKPMNEALSSRFPEGYVIEDVPENEFVAILVAAGYARADCVKVYRVYKQILNYLREYHEELSLSITLRHCLNALDKLKIGFTEKQAYENTFLSQLYSSDPEVAKDIQETLGVLM